MTDIAHYNATIGGLTSTPEKTRINPVPLSHMPKNTVKHYNGFGWGLGLSGRTFITDRTSCFTQYSANSSIGLHRFDAPRNAATFTHGNPHFEQTAKTQCAHGLLFGCEHVWTNRLRSNLWCWLHNNYSSGHRNRNCQQTRQHFNIEPCSESPNAI